MTRATNADATDKATSLAEMLLSATTYMARREKHRRRRQGWCTGAKTQKDKNNVRLAQKRRKIGLFAALTDISRGKAAKKASKELKRARASAMQQFLEVSVTKLEKGIQENDQLGFNKHPKRIGVEGKKQCSS